MDQSRLKDLEILTTERKKANTEWDRRDIDRTIERIMRESVPLRSLREDLVKATRAGDRVAVKKIVMHINRVRQDETYGKEIS